ncbi:hypothetical protein T01_12183 [Trichinella spiralis]|uniref:Uncharacterized protein n=1 Tax=Trichinella spiralis TaxID=6334 RepID=A0A0V1ALS4_TRISP|nr:hypothetical protein T01_12183 [Trichinella spiralis]
MISRICLCQTLFAFPITSHILDWQLLIFVSIEILF